MKSTRSGSHPAVFLDRDGTLIEDTGYLNTPELVRLLPTVTQALRLFEAAAYERIVITNQSGVARGMLNEDDIARVGEQVDRLLAEDGASIDAVYYCPHLDNGCNCRKPLPGLILTAAAEHDIDLSRSVMIGDRGTDIEAGHAAGLPSVLVTTGPLAYAGPVPEMTATTLLDAAHGLSPVFSKPLEYDEAKHLLGIMRNRRVLVIGDIMIDEWIWGHVSRISPEAPVPVVAVNDHSFTLGGAGNVANNLRALGAAVSFAGIVGNDAEGERVLSMLQEEQVDQELVLRVSDRPTTRKTRVVAHNQQVVRADWESSAPLRQQDVDTFCKKLAENIEHYDAIVLSDYAKGVFSRRIVETALVGKIVVADPKPKNIDLFSGVTCVAPNVFEASGATGIDITDDARLAEAGAKLLERLQCKYVVITLGERGMSLFGANGEHLLIPSVARTVFDVSGAGDTVTAVLTLALAAGAPILSALQLANFSAGAVVEKLGTATATSDEILAFVEAVPGA